MDTLSIQTTETTSHTLETYKSDKTANVTNTEFLEAIFGKEYSDMRPLLVSFQGNPHNVPKFSWLGNAWSQETCLLNDANNFFSLATFSPNEAGQYKRKKAFFNALYVIVLDDVGTKVKAEHVTLSPSWIIETSENNFQYGYILSVPLLDAAMADQLVNATIEAGLCDRGANGPTARIVRLPKGVNGKHEPAFTVRMTEWHPDRRYSIDQLVTGLNLDMNSSRKQKTGNVSMPDGSDPIFIPCATENAVIAALQERKLYKSPLASGLHDITCPWVAEHTDAADGGTGYYEPSDEYPIGGFHCFHGHCQHRHIKDLLQNLNIEVAIARMKPTIRVMQGEIHRIVEAAENELAKSGKYYQRGGFIVSIVTDPGTKEVSVKLVGKPSLISALSSVADWEKFDSRANKMVRLDPPERHCMVLSDKGEYRYLPVLNGLTRQPYLRPDGTIVTEKGYDASTGMYGIFDANDFRIPAAPTKEDAESALKLLEALLTEFSFKSEQDKSAALSALLTAVIRPSLSIAPMYHVKAPQIGSGKSFLCRVIGAFATPQLGTPTTFPEDDDECRKLLLAELMRSPAVIEFDNLTRDLVAHKSLCTSLTSEFMTGRILGVSKTTTVSTRSLFLSSGNNVGPVNDMARRCITINLDPACETPAARTFKNPDLLSSLLNNRGHYVSLALTIIRAWILADKPHTDCKSLASYGEWSELCRQPLLWLGLPDPALSVFETMMEDPDRETVRRLLIAWHGCFGSEPKMIRDALAYFPSSEGADYAQDLREIMQDIAGDRDNSINKRRLGWWMKHHLGQVVEGKRLIRAGGNRSAEAWKVETVS